MYLSSSGRQRGVLLRRQRGTHGSSPSPPGPVGHTRAASAPRDVPCFVHFLRWVRMAEEKCTVCFPHALWSGEDNRKIWVPCHTNTNDNNNDQLLFLCADVTRGIYTSCFPHALWSWEENRKVWVAYHAKKVVMIIAIKINSYFCVSGAREIYAVCFSFRIWSWDENRKIWVAGKI